MTLKTFDFNAKNHVQLIRIYSEGILEVGTLSDSLELKWNVFCPKKAPLKDHFS